MTDDVRVVFDRRAFARILLGPALGHLLLEAAEPGVREAKARAPKRTGAGAFSIRAQAKLEADEQTVRVAWDRLHFYMYWVERGTRKMQARPFLVPSFRGGRR